MADPAARTCPACNERLPGDFRFCGYCGVALDTAGPGREIRKTITVLFCDLKGSTTLGESLDSEVLRELIARYFERIRGVIGDHGGEIEKFIGDAVMAVFGFPHQREDDALRAVRCAAEMKRALAELNRDFARTWGVTLTNRTGVNTGTIVAGDPTRGERLVGDAVNVAARLEQAAPPNEILIGPETYRLVRGQVEVEALEPLELKGKSEPVPAYRLVSSAGGAALAEDEQATLVGREGDLAALAGALEECVASAACRVVTVIGEPGVGKSRLVEEFGRRQGVRMVEGRCLSYGRGITFWPLTEIVTQAAGISDEDDPAEATAKLVALSGGDPLVAERVATAVGLTDAQLPVEETFWGIRKLLEAMAAERPLTVVFQDLHWAEPTLLDLVEYLIDSVDGPVLLVCPARPELATVRPELEQRPGVTRIELGALTTADVEELVSALLGGEIGDAVRARIAEAAGGNPLFVEQLVSMMVDEGLLELRDGRWTATAALDELRVPPTLQALLGARLDQLQREELAVIEPASVIGVIFPRDALEALVADEVRPQVDLRISSLAVRQLIREETAHAVAGESYRFGHVHIREAAYNRLLKRERAVLHERFVNWGEALGRERGREGEFEEIVAYHLEQAFTNLAELGPLDRHGRELGVRAGEKLIASGRRALARGDMPAAASLLQRAAAVLPARDPTRLELLPELAEALVDVGRYDEAERYLDEAVQQAGDVGDERLRSRARLIRLHLESQSGESQDWADQVASEVASALPVFEAAADHASLAMAHRLLAWANGTHCNYRDAATAAERAVDEARAADDHRQRRRAAVQYAVASVYGPTPVAEAIERCQTIIEEARGDHRTVGVVGSLLSRLEAMRGNFGEARRLYTGARLTLSEMGDSVVANSTSLDSCGVEMLAGDPAAAERELRRDYEALEAMGERYLLSTLAGELARVLYAQGRYDEAYELSATARDLSSPDDITSEAMWRLTRAKVLAQRGAGAEARVLVEEASRLMDQTDAGVIRDEGLADVAEVLRLCGDVAAARSSLEEALRGFMAKGNEVAAAAARAELDALSEATATTV